jgi:hypothetical protein
MSLATFEHSPDCTCCGFGHSYNYQINDFCRAMMVYTSTDDLSVPVIRCPNHQSPADTTINKTAYHNDQHEHVIWAAEPARYERNLQSGRLSLVTSYGVPHIGSGDYVTHVYKFTCLGSCTGGINRDLYINLSFGLCTVCPFSMSSPKKISVSKIIFF